MENTTPPCDPGPVVVHDMPEDDYHADPAISQSNLKVLIDRSPAHYRWHLDNPSPTSASMIVGRLVHALILDQPHPFAPIALDGRTKAGKEERAELAANGKTGVSLADWEAAEAMRNAVLAHQLARSILERDGRSEVSMWWNDDETGLRCRGRIDRVSDNARIDLKTTRSAHPDEFVRSVRSFGYHVQNAHYLAGADANGLPGRDLVFIAVESAPPHVVEVYTLDSDLRDEGAALRRHALDHLAECTRADSWPGYGDPTMPSTLLHPYPEKL